MFFEGRDAARSTPGSRQKAPGAPRSRQGTAEAAVTASSHQEPPEAARAAMSRDAGTIIKQHARAGFAHVSEPLAVFKIDVRTEVSSRGRVQSIALLRRKFRF